MRLLLIILIYLCSPLYFTVLQASGKAVLPSEYLALVQQKNGAANFVLASGAEKEEGISYTKVAVRSLARLVLYTNTAIENIRKFADISLKVVDYPVSQITETGARILRDLFSGYYPYVHKMSHVHIANESDDHTTEVGSGMHAFRTKRMQHVQNSLHEHFGIVAHGSAVPKIALAISGGGMRAALCTAGFLAGAEQTRLLDCVMYSAAISGGTWALGSASYLFAKSHPRVSFTEFKNILVQHVDKGIPSIPGRTDCDYLPPYMELTAKQGIVRNVFRRIAWDQPLTSMEYWGATVANIFLQGVDGWNQSVDGKRMDVKFSDVAVAAQQGILPLPMLATAVPVGPTAEEGNPHGYKWMAFTPLRAGTKNIGGYLPMWAMGRSYIEGQSDLTYKGFAGEYSLSYLLGACGSAFDVNLKYFLGNENLSLNVQGVKIPLPIDISKIADLRFYPFKIHNFMRNIPNTPLEDQEFMKMVDGALSFNIPLPLVTKPEDTAADIIIMLDSDSESVNASETSGTLETINRYFSEINPGVMPVLDSTIAIQLYRKGKVFHIFNDPRDELNYNSSLPVVVYFPLIRNKQYSQVFDPAGFVSASNRHPEVQNVHQGRNYLSTFNFKYTHHDARELADLMEANIKQAIPEIKKMLTAYMKHHNKNEKEVLQPSYKDKKPGVSFDFDR